LPKGGVGHEPLFLQAASSQRGHIRLYARLIDKDEPPKRTFIVSGKRSLRLAAHERLAMVAPCLAGRLDVSAFFL
jgi:hypothetical protein